MDESTIVTAFGDSPSEFDKIFSAPISKLDVLPKRITLNRHTIELDNSDENAKMVYKTIVAALRSEWFYGLGTQSKMGYMSTIKNFLIWLSQKEIKYKSRFELLKSYEAYRVNDCGVKPQSTGLKVVIVFLSEGVVEDVIERETQIYIELLLDSTTPSFNDERQSHTLTSYFATMPWLRNELGEHDYLQLESPKRLISSFSVTVASTLLMIAETKCKIIEKAGILKEVGIKGKKLRQKADRMNHWSSDLLTKLGTLESDSKPADILTELILLDCVAAETRLLFLKRWYQKKGTKRAPLSIHADGKRYKVYKFPYIFEPKWISCPSPIEELLFAWLCAWQMIQPADVKKIKRKDFVLSTNHVGRAVSLQCQYYKGRSGREMETPLIDANCVQGKAILAYLKLLPSTESRLFSSKFNPEVHSTFTPHSPIAARLARLWKSEIICKRIAEQIKREQSNGLFIRVFNTMASCGGEGYDKWDKRGQDKKQNRSIAAYRRNVHNPLHTRLFSLMAIKTSAVHARTDKYRDNDLVNQNSHSVTTEKINYLTDDNKEWVNQNGRLTRLVLHDIERYVYRPNIKAAKQATHDLRMRTRVVNDNGFLKINSLGRVCNGYEILANDIELDTILILDTPETVVYMQHYITEAERQYESLIEHALSFFELTVLPNVEWMHSVLQQQLSPKIVRQGLKDYQKIKAVLPSLFTSELRGGVS